MRILCEGSEREIHIKDEKKSILQVIRENFACSFSSCAKTGSCGRCRIRIITGMREPGDMDRKWYSREELKEGYRLACQTLVEEDMIVETFFVKEKQIDIMTTDYVNNPSHVIASNRVSNRYGIAIDLGTTTIGCSLFRLSNGSIVDTAGIMNPERIYGADVLARIQQANEGKLFVMQEMIHDTLRKQMEGLIRKNQICEDEIADIILAGNTTMLHILQGQSCESLGKSPFTPFTLEKQEMRIVLDRIPHKITILPGLSAFVGADIVSGLYMLDIMSKEEISLFLDLGTNGEMAIGNQDRLIATATAAGPAFEGDITANLPGTDMIDTIGQLLKSGKMDSTGLLCEELFDTGYALTPAIRITQKHVRDIQLAKAAVFCGIQALMEAYSVTERDINKVYLAGGFGQKLSVDMAFDIGLLPAKLQGKVVTVGNSSLSGCKRYACESAQDRIAADNKLQHIRERATVINLAEVSNFDTGYMEALNFPSSF